MPISVGYIIAPLFCRDTACRVPTTMPLISAHMGFLIMLMECDQLIFCSGYIIPGHVITIRGECYIAIDLQGYRMPIFHFGIYYDHCHVGTRHAVSLLPNHPIPFYHIVMRGCNYYRRH